MSMGRRRAASTGRGGPGKDGHGSRAGRCRLSRGPLSWGESVALSTPSTGRQFRFMTGPDTAPQQH